ncbi:MAG: HXXEE domain-containing protein [Lactobacillus sp.]|jgi:hypothetical protein|uniref:HXXEE domain-containing protein n=1 Tax=Lacticaseibacillus suilingensis TaxID=2799577 RepID=A0ABW4BEI2_9LACO|nr:HXXEE domain-containing protein [Lacticaseibacillus suilingensis]MCI1894260.1 HXXEE domain-containing protein [Lactobacillus sp.]MCI1916895.1 HXXEE domain-containing protein [Lactobacillus sp.]MCI1942099.1 HXXEE domain-containing protein [Lactobacillus sp.]MCI1972438.1 HXXEE domain-containing protein [Lactobacillus sp.]MCI2017023.1 HXXEE domain-containing protein [Lactobacillus sp.]
MQWFRNYWYRVGGIILVTMMGWLWLARPQLGALQLMTLLNLMALFAHQLEEYQCPGGAPMVINRVVYDETKQPDRFPGNALSIMLVNVSAWLIYGIAIALPDLIWWGTGVMLFSLFQILGHCLEMNLKLKTWYNPGMATTLLLFLPLGWRYLAYVLTHHLLTTGGWLAAFGMLVACLTVTIILPVQGLKNRNTPYPIDAWQVQRFDQVTNWARIRK